MMVLFETSAGYAFFKLLDEKRLSKIDDLYKSFESPETATKVVKLKHFEKFADTTEALAASTALIEGKLNKVLKKGLKKILKEVQDQLLISDAKLGNAIKDKYNVSCMSNNAVQELLRCIRSQTENLIAGVQKKEITAMELGLAHSLSRYKLKFSPDKVDTMIVQAINLLDDLDKELNNYVMRSREWYGWHFPELGKMISDNIVFVKLVKLIGTRDNASTTDLSDILPEDLEEKVKEAAELSMGTEISDDDIVSIQHLCDQVVEISNYRAQLYDYLKARMMAIAPNLTVLLGELVGARLISHAGSLLNLAKHPASTIQILGAEKALFRALKTQKETPKYGLIYHSTLVSSASVGNKGKMSRSLAAKTALATRVDALGESEEATAELGIAHRAKLEQRLQYLEEGNMRKVSGTAKAKAKFEKYHSKSEVYQYPTEEDSTIPSGKRKHSQIKRDPDEGETSKPYIEDITPKEETSSPPKKKKKTKHVVEVEEVPEGEEETLVPPKKKKKTKHVAEEQEILVKQEPIAEEEEEIGASEEPIKKKKKKKKSISEEGSSVPVEECHIEQDIKEEVETSPKKKKKKKI